MDEMTVKLEQPLFRMRGKRLLDLLQTAARLFRSGEDSVGIENLVTAASELKSLVEADQCSKLPQIDLSRLLPSLKELYFYIHNQDITGIADFLEDSFCLLTEQWTRGCGDT